MIQQPFISLLDQILSAKTTPLSAPLLSKAGSKEVIDISALEKQIDEMVYALYGLTPEEIALVEGKIYWRKRSKCLFCINTKTEKNIMS